MSREGHSSSDRKPKQEKRPNLIRFDFPPNTPPDEVVRKLRELHEKYKKRQ